MNIPTPIPNIGTSNNQKGDMLLEALISVVLMGIVAMGITFALSKVAVNTRDTKAHIVVVNEMRELLLNTSRATLCSSGASINVNGVDEAVSVSNCGKIEVKVVSGGATVGTGVMVDAPLTLSYDGYVVGGVADAPIIASASVGANEASPAVGDTVKDAGAVEVVTP